MDPLDPNGACLPCKRAQLADLCGSRTLPQGKNAARKARLRLLINKLADEFEDIERLILALEMYFGMHEGKVDTSDPGMPASRPACATQPVERFVDCLIPC